MHLRTIQTSYLLGISLILTGIIYLFAANWGYFDRVTKIALSISLLILFYLIHFLLKRLVPHRPFLGNWSLFSASIVFGIAVALIGQIYNSHADSYQLFLVWLIPVLALAFITKYVPFYVLAFTLANLTMFFFIYPSSYTVYWSPDVLFLLLMIMAICNAMIFLIAYKNRIKSKAILYLAYIMTFSLLYFIAVNDTMPIHQLFNVFYLLLLLLVGYFFLKKRHSKSLFTVTAIFAALFLVFRVFHWLFSFAGEWVYFVLLFFAIALTLIGTVIIGILNRNKLNRFLSNLLIIIITLMTTLFATVAIAGIFFLIFSEAAVDVLYFFAIITLVGPALLMKLNAQIRYTFLSTGFVIGFISAVFVEHLLYEYLLLILVCTGMYIVKTKGIKVLLYLFANLVLYTILLMDFDFQFVYLAVFVLNMLYYIFQRSEKSTNYTAFVMILLNFMALTFLDLQTWLQIFYNLTFLIAIGTIILSIDKQRYKFKWTVSFVLWFIFIGYNYYEYLWSLVHKSIAAIIIGGVFIGIAVYFERHTSKQEPESKPIRYRTSIFIILIFVQIGFIGMQSFSSEKLLVEGELIKLDLQPIDPRSLLQGDYVILHYQINNLEIEEEISNKKIKVLLRENAGIYEYAGNYQINNKWFQEYDKQPGDVIINGTMFNYSNIVYGIESYFVQEGTGRDLETSAKYAYVRVSDSGNALLERIE